MIYLSRVLPVQAEKGPPILVVPENELEVNTEPTSYEEEQSQEPEQEATENDSTDASPTTRCFCSSGEIESDSSQLGKNRIP